MKCALGHRMERRERAEMIRVGPRAFTSLVEIGLCRQCGTTRASTKSRQDFERRIARWIAGYGASTWDELDLMRKAARLPAALLEPSTVIRALYKDVGVGPPAETCTVLAALVLEKLTGKRPCMAALLRVHTNPSVRARVPLKRLSKRRGT